LEQVALTAEDSELLAQIKNDQDRLRETGQAPSLQKTNDKS
jgi:hypothetical protein